MRTALALFAFLGVMVLVGSIEASGNPVLSQPLAYEVAGKPRPCYRHHEFTEPTKKACLRNYWKARRAAEKQARRDRLEFPPNPTMADVKKRVPDWYRFVRLGRCEQPGYHPSGDGVNWNHQGPTWGGGTGLYKTTWDIAGSGYPRFSGKAESILVSAAIRDRFGITAWGAHRCFWHGPNRPVGREGRE